jgi:hypothetical protein
MKHLENNVTLSVEQFHSIGNSLELEIGLLSPYSKGEDIDRVTNPDLVTKEGTLHEHLRPAFYTLLDPFSATNITILRPDTVLDMAFYLPGNPRQLPPASIITKEGELNIQTPAPFSETMLGILEAMQPATNDEISLETELSLTAAWVFFAVIDWLRNYDDEKSLLDINYIQGVMKRPMVSLAYLAAYYREALDLANASKAEIEKACQELVNANLLIQGKNDYSPTVITSALGNALDSFQAHLFLMNKTKVNGDLYEMVFRCIQNQVGLCLLWYEVDNRVQIMSASIDQVLHLVEQLSVNPFQYYES